MWERIEPSPTARPNQWMLQLLSSLISDVDVPGYQPEHDIAYIENRFSCEGATFLSQVLPAFDAAVLHGIETGEFLCPTNFQRFKNAKWAALPKFLSGLTKYLFKPATGQYEPYGPHQVAFKAIHQICVLFSKLRAPKDPRRETAFMADMLALDASLPDLQSLDLKTKQVLMSAATLLEDVLRDCDLLDIHPKHGPGAVSTAKISQYEKYFLASALYTRTLNSAYPYYAYMHPCCERLPLIEESGQIPFGIPQSGMHGLHGGTCRLVPRDVGYFRSLDRYVEWWREARCTRTVCVPKTAKKLRVISAEPIPNMAIQLGQNAELVRTVENHRLTRGHVNFTTQEVNRQLALLASKDGLNATLDMSNASDRVSVNLVKKLFPARVTKLLLASRTAHTKVEWPLTGFESYRKLNKFAPMGSGVCFPVESLVFWSLAVAAIYRSEGNRLRNVSEAAGLVYTYGDDLIVPAEYAEHVMNVFAPLGLLFNKEKSFYRGRFRESCGVDAYDGVNVTPIKVRKHLPRRRSEGSNLLAFNKYAEAFLDAGWLSASECCALFIERVTGPIPFRLRYDTYLGRVAEDICEVVRRSNHNSVYRDGVLRSVFVEGWQIEDSKPSLPECGDAGLWHWYSSRNGLSPFRQSADANVKLRRKQIQIFWG